MKLYFAGAEGDGPKINLRSLGVERTLVTYAAGERNCVRIHERFPSVFLDSGAFSAMTRGEQIDLDKYMELCARLPWDSYAALDVIGDAKATMRNAERMIDAGLKPIVAFHYGSSYKDLHALCERFDHIALGGLVPLAKYHKRLAAHLDGCFAVLREHWPVKVHAFGMQAYWLLERYPFYSVDSTTWLMGHKRGRFRTADGRMAGIGTHAPEREVRRLVGSSLEAAAMLSDLTDRTDIYAATRHNVRALLRDEAYATKLWTRRGITWED